MQEALARSLEVLTEPPLLENMDSAYDVHAVSLPARTYTGDFYYTAERSGARWIALGDVAGKGLSAAIFMAMILEQLESLTASAGCDPAAVVRSLDEMLRPEMPGNKFATVVVARLKPNGEGTVVNAGHCPILIRRRDGRIEEIDSHGPAIGILCHASWSRSTFILEEGDTLFLYSDGLPEAQSADEEELGLDRVRASLALASAASARDTARSVLEDLDDFRGGEEQADDVTLLVVARPAA